MMNTFCVLLDLQGSLDDLCIMNQESLKGINDTSSLYPQRLQHTFSFKSDSDAVLAKQLSDQYITLARIHIKDYLEQQLIAS